MRRSVRHKRVSRQTCLGSHCLPSATHARLPLRLQTVRSPPCTSAPCASASRSSSPSARADGGGGATVTWETVAELWAHVRPITGDERLRHDQLAGRLTHEVWIRYRPGVLPAMRFRQGTRIYEIVAVLEVERRRRLKCLCEERSL